MSTNCTKYIPGITIKCTRVHYQISSKRTSQNQNVYSTEINFSIQYKDEFSKQCRNFKFMIYRQGIEIFCCNLCNPVEICQLDMCIRQKPKNLIGIPAPLAPISLFLIRHLYWWFSFMMIYMYSILCYFWWQAAKLFLMRLWLNWTQNTPIRTLRVRYGIHIVCILKKNVMMETTIK